MPVMYYETIRDGNYFEHALNERDEYVLKYETRKGCLATPKNPNSYPRLFTFQHTGE